MNSITMMKTTLIIIKLQINQRKNLHMRILEYNKIITLILKNLKSFLKKRIFLILLLLIDLIIKLIYIIECSYLLI